MQSENLNPRLKPLILRQACMVIQTGIGETLGVGWRDVDKYLL
jgi:hypothetical protein